MATDPRVKPGDPCGCDVCPARYALGAAWTHDGYCADCGSGCCPVMTFDGAFAGRAKLSEVDRKARHGRLPPPVPPPVYDSGPRPEARAEHVPAGRAPDPSAFLAQLIDAIPDRAARAQATLVFRGAQIAAPYLAPAFGPLAKRLAKAVRGRRRP